MKPNLQKILCWTPRVLAILFTIFIGLFATDAFSEGYTFWEAILGFIIHMIPAFLLVGAIAFAWGWPLYGGIVFIILSIVSIFFFGLTGAGLVLVAGPQSLIGLLFIS